MNELIIQISKREFDGDLKLQRIFRGFMLRRFPTEQYEGYIMEWASRFKSGSPEGYMDSISLSIYKDLLRE